MGYSHLRNIRKKKAWRGKPKVLHAGGTLESPAGLCKPPRVWPGGSRAETSGWWAACDPTAGRWQGWNWNPGVLTLKPTPWVMSQLREVQVTPPSHEAEVAWRCWSPRGFPVAALTGHGGDGISQWVQFRACLRCCWSQRGWPFGGQTIFEVTGKGRKFSYWLKGILGHLKKKEKEKERKAAPWHYAEQSNKETHSYLFTSSVTS